MSEPPSQPSTRAPQGRSPLAAICAAITIFAGVLAVGAQAQTQNLQERLSETESKLSEVTEQEGVLTTRIRSESAQLERLEVEVAELRNREAAVAAELAQKEAELDQAQARLQALREKLRKAIALLEQRLVAIYKSSEPDVLTVILQSHGFDDLLERTEYLQRLQDQDDSIISNVRELRDQMRITVNQVKAARDAIAERKRELERTRAKLERRTAELAAARKRKRATLGEVRQQKQQLEGDLSEISEQIQEQLATLGGGALPAGPIRAGAGGFIWPVNGSVTSGFGMRWGRMHEGVDISVPSGTPIRAAKSGSIVLASAYGGYGNYTCVSHGGGLSTCYAHQSRFARTSGSVSQGSILGYVGCTGHCFGDHLHFEVRINGQAVDPLGYL
ncbi:MAG: murein hydrolase activator EnvC family protein [Solirubrobacterales bacterium]